jgi:ketosteroid isomerase-like protein
MTRFFELWESYQADPDAFSVGCKHKAGGLVSEQAGKSWAPETPLRLSSRLVDASASRAMRTYVRWRISMQNQVTLEILKSFLEAFNRHDLDAIMSFFHEDCVFYMPRGQGPRGDRSVGKQHVRAALATRFEGIPDVHYGEDAHWTCGKFGVSEWTLTGTMRSGERIKVRGVDLLEFRDGKITRKDSFWKLIE